MYLEGDGAKLAQAHELADVDEYRDGAGQGQALQGRHAVLKRSDPGAGDALVDERPNQQKHDTLCRRETHWRETLVGWARSET